MESKVLRSLVLCAMVGLLFAFVGCSKSSPIIAPDENQTDNGLPRWLFWAGDGVIVDEDYAEKKADVTNVVLGAYYIDKTGDPWEWANYRRGYILKEVYDIPDADPAEMNVVAWTEWDTSDDAWQVYFRVVVDGSIDDSDRVKVVKPGGQGAASQTYPAVTARIHREDEFSDPLLWVDITYQYTLPPYNSVIWHARYIQDDADDYYNFTVHGPAAIMMDVSSEFLHPDIVYATYWEVVGDPPFVTFYDINKLLITYEKLDEYGKRHIILAESDAAASIPTTWTEYDVYDGDTDGPGWFPRIDAGLDDFDDNDDYLAGIVWHVYTDDGASVYYAYKIYNTSSPSITEVGPIDNMIADHSKHNGVPFIDIDPLENKLYYGHENYAHIVWTKVINDEKTNIKPYYRNSSMIKDTVVGEDIFYSAETHREGLPVISTYPLQIGNLHGTVEFISYFDYYGEYPVYSVYFWLISDDANDPDFTNTKTPVSSDPHCSSDEGPPWIHGPSSAVFGLTSTLCAWTEWSDDSAPDIYFDVN